MDPTPNDWPARCENERSLLARDSLRASGRLRLRVRGESMLPSLWPGDMAEIAVCSIDEVRPREVVLAIRDGRFFLHRFVARSKAGGFLLRGDSMPAADPEFPSDALLGRMPMASPLRWWSRPIGTLFSYCGPARRLALKLHDRWQQWQTSQRAQSRFSMSGYIQRKHADEGPPSTSSGQALRLRSAQVRASFSDSELPHARA